MTMAGYLLAALGSVRLLVRLLTLCLHQEILHAKLVRPKLVEALQARLS